MFPLEPTPSSDCTEYSSLHRPRRESKRRQKYFPKRSLHPPYPLSRFSIPLSRTDQQTVSSPLLPFFVHYPQPTFHPRFKKHPFPDILNSPRIDPNFILSPLVSPQEGGNLTIRLSSKGKRFSTGYISTTVAT